MSRYIDVNKYTERLQDTINFYKKDYPDGSIVTRTLETVIKELNDFPTADAELIRHGHWIKVFPRRIGRNATYKCSVCKKLRSSYYNDVAEWDHCPCGAKMDGKKDEQ